MKWFTRRYLGKGSWSLIGVMTLALIDGHAAGQCETQVLNEGGPQTGLGWSVGVSGDVAIIGEPSNSILSPSAGAASFYRFDGASWILEQTVFASDAAMDDRFGFSVAISGNVAIIGAWFGDMNLQVDSGDLSERVRTDQERGHNGRTECLAKSCLHPASDVVLSENRAGR